MMKLHKRAKLREVLLEVHGQHYSLYTKANENKYNNLGNPIIFELTKKIKDIYTNVLRIFVSDHTLSIVTDIDGLVRIYDLEISDPADDFYKLSDTLLDYYINCTCTIDKLIKAFDKICVIKK